MTFKRWLITQHESRGPIGDIARDLVYDLKDDSRQPNETPLPRRITYGTLRAYLEDRGACNEAISALEEAHREWKALARVTAQGG